MECPVFSSIFRESQACNSTLGLVGWCPSLSPAFCGVMLTVQLDTLLGALLSSALTSKTADRSVGAAVRFRAPTTTETEFKQTIERPSWTLAIGRAIPGSRRSPAPISGPQASFEQ